MKTSTCIFAIVLGCSLLFAGCDSTLNLDPRDELSGDKLSQTLDTHIGKATAEDWPAEYLDLILAIRVVSDVEAAIEHINTYGSKHSDAIIATDEHAQKRFTHFGAQAKFCAVGEAGRGVDVNGG